MLEECHSKLNEEKAEDQKMRDKYGDAWAMQPSDEANKEIRQRLDIYRENLMKAAQTDSEIKSKLKENNERFSKSSFISYPT